MSELHPAGSAASPWGEPVAVPSSGDPTFEARRRRTAQGADLSRRSAGQLSRVEALVAERRAIRKHLAKVARRVAETQDRLAAAYERIAQTSPERAERLRARVEAARQFAKFEREVAERYEAAWKDVPKGPDD